MSTQTTANSSEVAIRAQVSILAKQQSVRTQVFWLLAAIVLAVGLPFVSNDYWGNS